MTLDQALRSSVGLKARVAFGTKSVNGAAKRPTMASKPIVPSALRAAVEPMAPLVAPSPVAPAADPVSRRMGKRKPSAIPCIVSFRGLRLALPCRILDMSVGGACIQLPQAAKSAYDGDVSSLPSELTLHLKVDRMQYDGQIMWRAKDRVGIRFSGPPRIVK